MITQPAKPEATPARWNRGRYRLIAVILTVVAIAGGACAYAVLTATPTLTSLVPQTAYALVSADAPWWWKTAEPIRDQPVVADKIKALEGKFSVSVDDDILPWAGHVSGAVLGDPNAKKPDLLVYVEVRDWDKFLATFAKIRDHVQAAGDTGKWTDTLYGGVHIQGYQNAKGDTLFQTTIIGSWLILGTPGAPAEAIDTWQNKTPSIEKSATWQTALAKLPQASVLWGGVDGAKASKVIQNISKSPAGAVDTNLDSVTGLAFSDTGNGFRVDSVSVAANDHTRNFSGAFVHGFTPISSAAVRQLPADANFSEIVNNPYLWLTKFRSLIATTMPAAQAKQFKTMLTLPQPVEKVLSDYTGDTSVSISIPSLEGISFTLVSQTPTTTAAQNRVASLVKILRAHKVTLWRNGTVWNVKMPDSEGQMGPVIAPAFRAAGSSVKMASNATAVSASTAGDSIALPAEFQGSQVVALGNFKFLPVFANLATQMATATKDKKSVAAADIINAAGLAGAKWYATARTEPDGSIGTGTFVMENWDWHTAFSNIVQAAVKDIPAATATDAPPAVPGPVAPGATK